MIELYFLFCVMVSCSGDSYIPGTKVVTNGLRAIDREAQDSWEKLKSYELSGVK